MKIIISILLVFAACHVVAEVEPDSKNGQAARLDAIREQLKAAEEINKNKDYSAYSTAQLVDMALSTVSPGASEAINKVLSQRPDQLRAAILREIEHPSADLDVLYRLPFIAGLVGSDFQVDIAKRALFHNGMKEVDLPAFFGHDPDGGLLGLIAQSKENEMDVIDRLVAEGRLEKDSEFAIKWKEELSHGTWRATAVDKTPDDPVPDSRNAQEPEAAEANHSMWAWLLGGLVLIAICVLLLRSWR